MKRLLPLLFLVSLAIHAGADPLADGIKTVSAYDYGTDRTNIVAFDTYIRTQPGDRAKVEAALIPLLSQSTVSVASKDYICRWLGLIGSDASVPALEKLTTDPKLSHIAVYALLCQNSPAAKTALVDTLAQAPASLRPAIIGAIGRTGDADAIPALTKVLSSNDAAQVSAALDALAAIGNTPALDALSSATVPSELEATHKWAILHAATHVLATSPADGDKAKNALADLVKPGTVSSLRVAAAHGYLKADPASAWTVIAPLLKDSDAKVSLDVARLTAQLPPDNVAALVTALPSFDPAVQVVIVNSAAANQSAAFEPVLQTALASTQADVHLAAIAGYGTAILPDSATILLPFLDKGGDEAAAASASLEKLSLPDISGKLTTAVASAKASAKAALLTILAARMDRSALDLFFASTTDPDNGVAEAAFQGINTLAGPDDLNRVVALLPQAKTGAEHKSLDSALQRCARFSTDKDKAADFLLAGVPASSGDTRNSLLEAIASIDSPKATAGLQAMLQATSVDDRKTVIRALSSVHNPDADKLLLTAAEHGQVDSEKVLALRGYLDSIRAQDLHDDDRVKAYRTAWPLATRDDDKQSILDALKNLKGNAAKKALSELSAEAHKPA